MACQLHPEFLRRLERANERLVRRTGKKFRINSGCRPREDQDLFYRCAQEKRRTGRCPSWCSRSGCASANPPGYSWHEPTAPTWTALAADLDPNGNSWANVWSACEAEGIFFPIKHIEEWHCQPVETARWGASREPSTRSPAPFDRLPPSEPPVDPDPRRKQGRTEMLIGRGVGAGRIVNLGSGEALDVGGGKVDDGAPVIMWTPHGGDNQRVYLAPYNADKEEFVFVFKHSGRVLDIYGAKDEVNAVTIQWPFNGVGSLNQAFRLVRFPENRFAIQTCMPSGLFLRAGDKAAHAYLAPYVDNDTRLIWSIS